VPSKFSFLFLNRISIPIFLTAAYQNSSNLPFVPKLDPASFIHNELCGDILLGTATGDFLVIENLQN
jgi:hypothetical protein